MKGNTGHMPARIIPSEPRIEARRTMGPQGGMIKWAVYIDGVILREHGSVIKRSTQREALEYGRSYAARNRKS